MSAPQMAYFEKRANKWRAMVRKKGHRTLTKTFSTKGAAQVWARETERGIERTGTSSFSDRADITIKYLIDRFIDEFEPQRTKKGSLNILKKGLGHLHLTDFGAQDIVAHCKRRRDVDGVSQGTQQQDIGFLAEVLRTARAYWQIPFHADPVGDARMILRRLGLIGRPRERKRRPTEDELERLRDLWNRNPRQTIPMADIMDFAIASAWRLGEITRVSWADFDRKRKTIIIRDRKDPREKRGNDQEVPVFPDMMKIITRQKKNEGPIFPYNEKSISTAFTRACQKLGIVDLHFHDLRHEGTSRLFERGFRIEQVALCTGHKDWKMLARYTQLKASDLHKAVKA